ncbi:hypothetical protein LX36DRAFT_387537 [Colletotrichum falcatum]|nr:hypothetical protein LX36DRAFT_387537 [Colletotrichum falcatum]
MVFLFKALVVLLHVHPVSDDLVCWPCFRPAVGCNLTPSWRAAAGYCDVTNRWQCNVNRISRDAEYTAGKDAWICETKPLELRPCWLKLSLRFKLGSANMFLLMRRRQ